MDWFYHNVTGKKTKLGSILCFVASFAIYHSSEVAWIIMCLGMGIGLWGIQSKSVRYHTELKRRIKKPTLRTE